MENEKCWIKMEKEGFVVFVGDMETRSRYGENEWSGIFENLGIVLSGLLENLGLIKIKRRHKIITDDIHLKVHPAYEQ